MNKISKQIDSYFIGLFLEIFVVVALFMTQRESNMDTLNFIMLCITFFTIIMTYAGGIVIGLILSSVVILKS